VANARLSHPLGRSRASAWQGGASIFAGRPQPAVFGLFDERFHIYQQLHEIAGLVRLGEADRETFIKAGGRLGACTSSAWQGNRQLCPNSPNA
jgi:hypothetical protein